MSDWKDGAFQAFARRWADEEADWQKNNPGKVKIYLKNASDEPVTFSVQGQASLREVIASLKKNKIEADAPFMTLDSVDAVGGYTGEIVILATAFGPLLTGILVAWLQTKAGRKVRLKDGDIEVEAQTVEEAGKLLNMVMAQRAKRDRKED